MNTVLVVAKAPVPGLVKTRLTTSYSPLDAARLASAALLDTLLTARSVRSARCAVALSGRIEDAVDAGLLREALTDCIVFEQQGDGLAERIVNAHRTVADRFDGPVLQIGMDTPQVDVTLLARGLTEARRGATLGPATDGGWWALGLPHVAAKDLSCLLAVPMSTPSTGAATRRALTEAGQSPTILPILCDVDYAADVPTVAAECPPESRFRHTAHALRSGELGTTA